MNKSTQHMPMSKYLGYDFKQICRHSAVARNTTWHETYSKYEVGKRNAVNEKLVEKELV